MYSIEELYSGTNITEVFTLEDVLMIMEEYQEDDEEVEALYCYGIRDTDKNEYIAEGDAYQVYDIIEKKIYDGIRNSKK